MNTLERIKEYLELRGLSNNKFSENVGLSNGSFAKQLKSKGAIGSDKVEKILECYPDINPTWLMTGNGKMLRNKIYKITESEAQLDLLKEMEDMYPNLSIDKKLNLLFTLVKDLRKSQELLAEGIHSIKMKS